ncbi:PWWP domain-containing DNA repair factor 3A-like isoform X1 [Melanotaenia boesemani]|uniref:PWWP domain-containing DNA repair factor 3A-like isoform X1 n=1 Tax=Melanotaenia boesemani TaxID=1250792 RepID=UPI001C03C2C8|nr:PWWP domain-containing DNA repair factor 3A-like isoform X1 [Melanotaenia boesemani]XP_041841824.1 PWWP domain-containing DNA repair factor 3A-like isoform X1 [Melanotaenia boesemani]
MALARSSLNWEWTLFSVQCAKRLGHTMHLFHIYKATRFLWLNMEERAQQAEQKRILASELLLTFITQDECLRQHLQAVIAGKLTPSWASKGRVRIFLEKEDQLDRVMSFLASLLEAQGTKCHDQVAFVMDVLLPEATLHAIAGVHAVSLHRATEIYECGLQYDYSEKQLFAHYASKNMSKEAEQKMLTYKEQLQRALESKDFVQML